MRWVGIDEAGYGPNLGPLVMTAVVAEGAGTERPDVWADCVAAVARAGGDPAKLWIDDSKRLHTPGQPPRRLEEAALAACAAVGSVFPSGLESFLASVGSESGDSSEWARWTFDGLGPVLPRFGAEIGPRGTCFDSLTWSLVRIECVVIGPSRFNRGLSGSSSKAVVHFDAFGRLLRGIWDGLGERGEADVRCDKHGGRHYYLEPLSAAFPEAWIERGVEGPAESRYRMRSGDRRLTLSLVPRADSGDGLVALASIISKYVRECWMDDFNAWWAGRVPGLAPTAGYPTDAKRFRAAIESKAVELGLDPADWWRLK